MPDAILQLRFPGAGLGVAYFSLFNTPMSAGEQIPESGRCDDPTCMHATSHIDIAAQHTLRTSIC